MLHTDSAYAMLSEALQKQGIELDSNEITEEEVIATASKNGIDLTVWFDASSQQFGFNMLTGGSKKYDNLDDFLKYFRTYFDISTEIVPKAKMISNIIEEEKGINTIYDSFKGNNKVGYSVVFRVLNNTKEELRITPVKNEENVYKAEILLYNDGKTQKKVEHEYLYEIDDDINVTELLTLDSYISGLSRYENDEALDIRRIGTYEFVITVNDDDSLQFTIEFNKGRVTYIVTEFNGKSVNLEVNLKDATNLYDLHDIAKSKLKPKKQKESEKEAKKDLTGINDLEKETGLEMSDINGIDNIEVDEGELAALGTGISRADDIMKAANEKLEIELEEDRLEKPSDATETVSEVKDEEVLAETEKEPEKAFKDVTEDIDVEVVKLVKTEGRITGVLFETNNGLYKISKEVALELLPLNAIEDFTESKHKKGILLTEEEINQKKFAKDVSYDLEFCNQLVEALFN